MLPSFTSRTEELLASRSLQATRAFRDQLDRAALSISNNIAESFERGTTNELLAFLYIARGSAGEVRSMLTIQLKRAADADLRSQISSLKSLAESCSRQLRAWANQLQNSDIQGQRHLNDRTRRRADQSKRAKDFQRELLDRLPPDHPLRKTQSPI